MGWEPKDLCSSAASDSQVVGLQKCHFSSLSLGFLISEEDTPGLKWGSTRKEKIDV